MAKGERVGRRSVRPQIFETFDAFCDGWKRSHRYPPQGNDDISHALEPLPPPTEVPGVIRPIDIVAERLDRLPDRHVDEDRVVLVRPDRGGVPVLGHQTPDKSGTLLRQRIDLVEGRHEFGDDRVIGRCPQAPDIDLGKVECPRTLGHIESSSLSFGPSLATPGLKQESPARRRGWYLGITLGFGSRRLSWSML
jgi:hypothetical protein